MIGFNVFILGNSIGHENVKKTMWEYLSKYKM